MTTISSLRIAHISEHSTIYGPGTRFVIWVQGCDLGCLGCWNTEFWPHAGGRMMQVQSLFEMINETEGIEGITLLGGEPLQQSSPVLDLITRVRQLNLSIS